MDMKTKSVLATDIRAVISQFRNHTIAKQKNGESYRLDRQHANLYMDGHRKMEEKVYDFLHFLRKNGEQIVYVDVCGRAKLGLADINYSFSLQENYWKHDKIPERVVGDLFSAKDFYGFLSVMRGSGHRPSFVTCEPVAGLNTYALYAHKKKFGGYEEVLYQRLENNLRAMIRLLRPGGFIYLTRVIQGEGLEEFFAGIPQEERRQSIFMKNLCRSMRCSVDIEATLGGPAFLIRKWLR